MTESDGVEEESQGGQGKGFGRRGLENRLGPLQQRRRQLRVQVQVSYLLLRQSGMDLPKLMYYRRHLLSFRPAKVHQC